MDGHGGGMGPMGPFESGLDGGFLGQGGPQPDHHHLLGGPLGGRGGPSPDFLPQQQQGGFQEGPPGMHGNEGLVW